MSHGTQVAKITLNDEAHETVENFPYLGSIVSNNFTLYKELNTRLGNAATSFGRLSKRVWSNKSLTLRTKLNVYHACVLSILLYGAETWTTYCKQELKINCFHLRCLRTILGMKWQDKITSLEILQHYNSTPLSSILKQRWLRWLGHIHHMPIDHLPKQIMYGELTGGKQPVGRPKLQYKDVNKKRPDRLWHQSYTLENSCWRTTYLANQSYWRFCYTQHSRFTRRSSM